MKEGIQLLILAGGKGTRMQSSLPKVLHPINERAQTIVVIPGDHPFVSAETIKNLVAFHRTSNAVLSLTTFAFPSLSGEYGDFYHFGRIVRDADETVLMIKEFKDASEQEKLICEVNLGCFCFDAAWLWDNIEYLDDTNAQKEYYLTDLVSHARQQGHTVTAFTSETFTDTLGINTIEQLQHAQKHMR